MIQLSRGNQLVAELAPINGVEGSSSLMGADHRR
jgi:hypothetical protein